MTYFTYAVMHRLFCEILFSFSPVSFLSFEHVNFWQIREATLFALSSLSEELLETEVGILT